MITHELVLFLAGLGFGIVARLLYILVTALEKYINLKVITIILDIAMSGLCVFAYIIMQFLLSDGVFVPYVFLSACISFVATSMIK